MKIAIVGCSFVADYYLSTLRSHPELEVGGLFDRLPERAELLAGRCGTRKYASLAAFLGPATSVRSFATMVVEDKLADEPFPGEGPDFSVACTVFASGIVARLTCSFVAPHEHGLRIAGDRGVLFTDNCWDFRSPVYSRPQLRVHRRSFLSPVERRGQRDRRFAYPVGATSSNWPRSRAACARDAGRAT